jgi:hypothetical protein
MKKEIADKLSLEYEYLWHESMREMPDGWIKPLVKMLDRMESLSTVKPSSFMTPSLLLWVNLRVEVEDSGAFAYATPMIASGRWHGPMALECITALSEFCGETQETCSVCGADGHLRMRILGGYREGVFCDEHKDVHRGDAARTHADALYQDVRDLFPEVHGSAINLNVPDHLRDLLASTLRSIHKLVIAEDIVGKVLITRIEMDDGALYVRVRYVDLTAVFMGVQMAVNEMISDLEVLSDEATRKHQHGGPDAS